MKEVATESELRVSDLTRLECRVGPIRQGDGDLLELYDLLFANEGVVHLPIGAATFETCHRASSAPWLEDP